MHRQKPDQHTLDRAPHTNEAAHAVHRRPVPEPRVAGTGYGAIGIAAVAAAVRYQGSSGNIGSRSGDPRRRS